MSNTESNARADRGTWQTLWVSFDTVDSLHFGGIG